MVQAAPANCPNRRQDVQREVLQEDGVVRQRNALLKLLARVPFAALGLLQDHLVFQPFADEFDLTRHARAGSLQRQPDEDQNIDDDEHQIGAAEQAFIHVGHR
ncbi:hypothetical protein RF55_17144 [Lasius niger]|uniref:Uncharacterized protein n=1 Tax=Lasius niger TaxID=67767 RepID=A0A0J7K3M9_LASNI|nr:hypothetical protein RF55_17144 [Lasius niger]